MKIKKILTLVILFYIVGVGSLLAAEKFSYNTAKPSTDSDDYSYYQPASSDTTLVNIGGSEIRNIILCIGDGMGVNHIALTRHVALGPDKKLHMERLPVVGLVRTYSANSLVTDSAAAGTAMACGIKTNNGMVSMSPEQVHYSSILERLSQKGFRTGLVATSEISHATPASFAAHVKSRKNQLEIATQMLDNRVDILFGGGRKYWSDKLLAEAVADGYQVAETRDQMLGLKPGPAIALFADEGLTTLDPEPMIAEMTQTAIGLLSSKSKEWFAPRPKFFLLIEGSQIDWAAHANDTETVIRQTLLFDMAVHEAIEFAKQDRKTLVIVTADHETGGLILESGTLNKGKIDADWEVKTHTAGDVPLYAFGPGSEHFSGILDNTDIPKRIAELTGLKEFPIIRKQSKVTGKAPMK
jgi:alkaline phosphatase